MKFLRQIRFLLLGLLAFASVAHATPEVGGRLPSIEIQDLEGHDHTTRELTGRRTFVLAMTDKDAELALRAWAHAADLRLPVGTHRVTMVLLDLAFFVPTATARSQARSQAPAATWGDTWLDVHHDLAEAARLPESETPYAFALDEAGRIVAMVHAPVDAPGAEAIWRGLAAP